MARLTIAMSVSMMAGGALLGCGGSEAGAPVTSPVATSPSSTPEPPNFTRNSGETAEADDQAATIAATDSIAITTIANDSTTVAPTTTDATNQATETTTAGTSTGSAAATTAATATATAATTTTATAATAATTTVAAASTSTEPDPGEVQDDIDLGVLTMKNFIIDLLGDGVQIVYDDIDLDDTELACVGRAEAAGIPADGFEELLFECLDDDSFGFVIRATDGDGDGGP